MATPTYEKNFKNLNFTNQKKLKNLNFTYKKKSYFQKPTPEN
jgi:hypothetical protein